VNNVINKTHAPLVMVESLIKERVRELNEGKLLSAEEVLCLHEIFKSLNELKVKMMHALHQEGKTYKEIGDIFDMTRVNAYYILSKCK
jgi:DNA-directed RNA polymerase specialized sigma subunit